MKDYISRAEAINEIMNDMVENATPDDKLYNTGLHRAMSRIDNIPTADVVPVVHGKWEEFDELYGDTTYKCSVCGEPWTLIDGTPQDNNMHYCPNCGAKMDGGGKE